MKTLCRSIIVGVTMLAGTSLAGAADLGSLKDPIVEPAYVHHSPARWYIRGDVGYAIHEGPELVENLIDTLAQTSWHDTWTLGGGIGYYFSQNLRGDITIDHRFGSQVSGINTNPAAQFAGGARIFDLKSTVVLANLYYDFGDRKSFTPYVGVGVGFTRNTTETGTVADSCGCTGIIEGKSKTDLAVALMAGFSRELRAGFKVDAGYRFLYLGSADTGPITDPNGINTTVLDPHVSHMIAHEIRVGLRYDLGNW